MSLSNSISDPSYTHVKLLKFQTKVVVLPPLPSSPGHSVLYGFPSLAPNIVYSVIKTLPGQPSDLSSHREPVTTSQSITTTAASAPALSVSSRLPQQAVVQNALPTVSIPSASALPLFSSVHYTVFFSLMIAIQILVGFQDNFCYLVPLCPKHSLTCPLCPSLIKFLLSFIYWCLEGGRDKEKNIELLFRSLMHSLVNSCMCPDWDRTRNLGVSGWCSNPLSLIKLLGQVVFLSFSPILPSSGQHRALRIMAHFLVPQDSAVECPLCQSGIRLGVPLLCS